MRDTETALQLTKVLITHKTSMWVWQNLYECMNINQKVVVGVGVGGGQRMTLTCVDEQ